MLAMVALNPTPYTLHPSHYSPHPTPYHAGDGPARLRVAARLSHRHLGSKVIKKKKKHAPS